MINLESLRKDMRQMQVALSEFLRSLPDSGSIDLVVQKGIKSRDRENRTSIRVNAVTLNPQSNTMINDPGVFVCDVDYGHNGEATYYVDSDSNIRGQVEVDFEYMVKNMLLSDKNKDRIQEIILEYGFRVLEDAK